MLEFADNPRTQHTVAKLEEFKQAIRVFRQRVGQEAREFIQRQLPHRYAAGARQAGVAMVEVFDGLDCGWTAHQDTDKASRSVRTVEDAAEWPISHPRCRRGFAPRPDLTSI